MNLSAFDHALLRMAGARSGAVARVSAVSHTEATRSVDPARGTDPRWLEIPRPDVSRIAIADIARFQSLVYAADADRAPPVLAPAPVQVPLDGPVPPADRIVGTLQHLRGLHGL